MRTLKLLEIEFIQSIYDTHTWAEITEKLNAKFGTKYKEDNLRITWRRKRDQIPDLNFTRDLFKDGQEELPVGVRLLVTGAGPTHVINGERVGLAIPEVVKTLKARAYAEPVILAGIGHTKLGEKQSAYYDISLKPLLDSMYTNVKLHNKLVAVDYKINPQQLQPLSRLYREGQKQNLIVCSPKQHLQVCIVGNSKHPHTVQSTGFITEPSYQDNGIGRLAEQSHVRGGIIVETAKDIFLTRKVSIDDNGGFYDIDCYIKGAKVTKGHRVECLVLGDAHVEHEDPTLTTLLQEIVEATQPKRLVLHDVLDGASTSPFVKGADKRHLPCIVSEVRKIIDWIEAIRSASYGGMEIIIVNSNHHNFVDRWLKAGEYHHDPINHKIGLQLKLAEFDGVSPMEFFFGHLKDVKILGPDDDYFVGDIQVANHGHKGPNGAKGSKGNTGKLAYRSITAHTHEPFERDGHTGVGHWSKHRHGYNTGGSGWMVSLALIQPDFSIQQIIPVKDKKDIWQWRIS